MSHRTPRPLQPARTRGARRALSPLALAAALAVAMPAMATDYVWTTGGITDDGRPAAITINDTLTIGCAVGYACGTTYANASFLNNGTVTATQSVYFLYPSNVWTNGWQYRMEGDVGLLNAAYGGTFINESSGSLVKTAGMGVSNINIDTQSRGGSIVDAITGTINFSGGTASFDSGAILLAASGAGISFTGGSVSFAEGVRFLGAGQYTIGTTASFSGAVGATQLAFTNGTYTGGDGSVGSGATLTSNATWSGSGTLAGSWTVAAGQTLQAQGGGTRYLQGAVTNLGTLNTDAPLYFLYPSHVLDNRGTLNLQGDVGLTNAAYGGTVLNSGTLAKTSGTGVASISGLNFTNNGGLIDVQSGTLQFSGTLAFNDGTRFTGAGVAQVASSASFVGRIDSTNLLLGPNGSSYTGGDGSTGNTSSQATQHGSTRWAGGNLAGNWELAADHSLAVEAGNTKYIYGSVTNRGVVNAADNLYFVYASHVLDNRGTLNLQGDVGMANVAYGGTLLNSGTLAKVAGAGASTLQGLGITVAGGVVDVQTGTLVLANSSTSLEAGSRLITAAGTELQFVGGQTTFAAGVALQGSGQFTLAGNTTVLGGLGAMNLALRDSSHTGGDGTPGSSATLTSHATWSGNGQLAGSWLVAAGSTLQAQGVGTRYVYGNVTNQGSFNTDAPLYFVYSSHGIDNQGTLNLQGDVGLVNVAYGGTITNSGTLAKTAGGGVASINGLSFTNNGGVIDVQSGTLQFNGSQAFNDGTRFTGAGTVQVLSSATFTGRIDASHLVLGNATYTGGDGSGAGPASQATLHGSTAWTGGSLAGNWQLAADHTLSVESGTAKYIYGNVVNHGVINASDNLYFVYASHVLDNRGTLNLQGDVGLLNVAYGGTVLNSGVINKAAGTGESNLASVSLVNTGTLDVQTGTLRLPANFSNEGVLTGAGTFAATTIVNLGSIAPGADLGASTGTLTLASHLTLGEVGSLQMQLGEAGAHDLLLVLGDATLGGTLALSCDGACTFTAGTDILLLDATGLLSGSFSQVTLAGFGSGAFDVVYDTVHSDVFLHITQDVTAAVPEPESYALWLGGLAALGLWLRRRRLI